VLSRCLFLDLHVRFRGCQKLCSCPYPDNLPSCVFVVQPHRSVITQQVKDNIRSSAQNAFSPLISLKTVCFRAIFTSTSRQIAYQQMASLFSCSLGTNTMRQTLNGAQFSNVNMFTTTLNRNVFTCVCCCE